MLLFHVSITAFLWKDYRNCKNNEWDELRHLKKQINLTTYIAGDFNMYIGDTVLNHYFEFNLLLIALYIQKKKNA